MNKLVFAVVALALLGACSTTPMRSSVLRQHAERNCHVEAAVDKTYAIDSTGASINSVTYQACMRRHGFVVSAQ